MNISEEEEQVLRTKLEMFKKQAAEQGEKVKKLKAEVRRQWMSSLYRCKFVLFLRRKPIRAPSSRQ